MVVVKRSSLASTPRHIVPPSPSTIPMGDEQLHANFPWTPRSPVPTPRHTRRSYSFPSTPRNSFAESSKPVRKSWSVLILCAITVISWTAALYQQTQVRRLVQDLERQHTSSDVQVLYQMETYQTNKEDLATLQHDVEHLKQTKATLEHELRAMETLAMDQVGLTPSPLADANPNIVHDWLTYRQDELRKRMTSLQEYLQNKSRASVLEKFGPGPHKVQFTVALDGGNQKRFVAQLAPLDLMPHAVQFFLDMIQSGVWDSTVLLHHEQAEHVLAAAPIDYASQHIKHHHLQYLGWTGLAFPEYSEQYRQHEKYTLGFAGQGPTFYINTMDNSQAHGPGGQGHHALPDDADPCFAEIVEGKETVDELIRLGMLSNNSKLKEAEPDPWADNEHTWTHLVKVEIL